MIHKHDLRPVFNHGVEDGFLGHLPSLHKYHPDYWTEYKNGYSRGADLKKRLIQSITPRSPVAVAVVSANEP